MRYGQSQLGLCLPRANEPLPNGEFLGRMAYELGLDMPNARPLPLDQLAAREILVRPSCFVKADVILTIGDEFRTKSGPSDSLLASIVRE